MDDIYYSVIREACTEIKVKGSKFIGYVKPVETIEQAKRYIDAISARNYNATHNCTAYKVGITHKSVYRYNDDGEPGGTGGRPIFDAINGKGLTNVVCVVTRYFGGTKLGTGGLSRAYRNCADQTLDKAGKKELFFTDTILIIFPYNLTGKVMEIIEKSKSKIIDKRYDTETKIRVEVKQSQSKEIIQHLINKTGGKIIIKELENEST